MISYLSMFYSQNKKILILVAVHHNAWCTYTLEIWFIQLFFFQKRLVSKENKKYSEGPPT